MGIICGKTVESEANNIYAKRNGYIYQAVSMGINLR